MTEAVKGIVALVVAAIVWGLSSLYYAQLRHLLPLEVLCYRSLCSLIFFAIILMWQGRLGQLRNALATPRKFGVIFLAATLIAANWFGFIFAIKFGYAVEASMGYYIFPLVVVMLGRFVLGETLSSWQWGAVALATFAVVLLAVGLGVPPWIALALAFTFGGYGLVKKQLDLGPVLSVTAEVLTLAPFALAYLFIWGTPDKDWGTLILLTLSGPLTASPLIFFAYGTRRVRLSTVGILQYVNPTLQFVVATTVFLEPFTIWHGIAFPLIWTALALYSVAAIRQDRASRRAVSSAVVSSTTVT